MKFKIYLFTILFFILTVNFSQNVAGQNQPRLTKEAEIDKREVQKFVDSFLEQLEQSKDITKVPKSFFAPNFPTQALPIDIEERFPKNTSKKLKYKTYCVLFNLIYLGTMSMFNQVTETEIKKSESKIDTTKGFTLYDLYEPLINKYFFPPKIRKLYRNKKILIKWMETFYKIKTPQELNKLTAKIEKVINAQRGYSIKKGFPKKKSYFADLMQDIKDIEYWDSYDIYQSVDSKGNKFIEIGGYLISLRITKVNGEPKVLDIFLLKDD